MVNKSKEMFPQDQQDKEIIPWWSIPIIVIISMMFLFSFVGRTFVIPSESMMPTLNGCQGCTNDRIIADKVSYYFSDPKQGDVVVFRDNGEWGLEERREGTFIETAKEPLRNMGWGSSYFLIKRVAATEGQTIQCLPGDPGIMVNGEKLPKRNETIEETINYDEKSESQACDGPYFGPITVEKDRLFVIGDNRQHSSDSRFNLDNGHNGTIPESNVYGKANVIFYPMKRIGKIK